MPKSAIKKSLVVTLTLALGACTGTVPNNIFNYTDKEFTFSTKDLTPAYVARKLSMWLYEKPDGAKLVKEITFAIFKYPDLFRSVMLENRQMFEDIMAVPQVQQRIAIDSGFRDFMNELDAGLQVFRVNTYTTNRQGNARVATDSDGDFIVAWMSELQDGSSWGVFAQRYSSSGSTKGAEFRISNSTSGYQGEVSPGMDSDGDFVIAWISHQPGGNDYDIYARRYNSNGTARASEFLVNTVVTTGIQANPSVAMNSDGNFVIAWTSSNIDSTDSDVYARIFDSSGTPAGPEFIVNTYTAGFQSWPSAAIDKKGNFVITWMGTGDGDNDGIYARVFDSSGSGPDPEFRVNNFTENGQVLPSAAMDDDGNFVITWASYYQNEDYSDVYARRYKSTGEPEALEFRVNSTTSLWQWRPSAAMDNDGDFVITFVGNYQVDYDYALYVRRYDSNGVPKETEFMVNSHTTGIQFDPATAIDSDGDFIVTWTAEIQGSYDVFAKRYDSNGAPR
jgi:hypothetical protein